MAHSKNSEAALEKMKERGRLAIGWTGTGDLRNLEISNAVELNSWISETRSNKGIQNTGGPSLWNLYHEMKIGDFVIVNSQGKRQCVFEVTGDYQFEKNKSKQIEGHGHQREAILTDLDPEELWSKSGSAFMPGQGPRWTLAACSISNKAKNAIHTEGARYSIVSTAIERNAKARNECIAFHGNTCHVCDFNFEQNYGDLGKGFIHVHHRVDLADKKSVHKVDPKKDLVPLCPNCHAMAHQKRPAISVEKLRKIVAKQRT